MKALILILLFVLLSSFSCTDPIHIRKAQEIVDVFTKKVKVEQNLDLMASGGAMMHDVKEIILKYVSNKQLTLDEARLLMVKNVELLLDEINNDSSIRPYLHDYPFTSKNIDLSLVFYEDVDTYVKPPYVAFASTIPAKDLIVYWKYDLLTDSIKVIHREPYEEALKIYKETMNTGNLR